MEGFFYAHITKKINLKVPHTNAEYSELVWTKIFTTSKNGFRFSDTVLIRLQILIQQSSTKSPSSFTRTVFNRVVAEAHFATIALSSSPSDFTKLSCVVRKIVSGAEQVLLKY